MAITISLFDDIFFHFVSPAVAILSTTTWYSMIQMAFTPTLMKQRGRSVLMLQLTRQPTFESQAMLQNPSNSLWMLVLQMQSELAHKLIHIGCAYYIPDGCEQIANDEFTCSL